MMEYGLWGGSYLLAGFFTVGVGYKGLKGSAFVACLVVLFWPAVIFAALGVIVSDWMRENS